MQSASAYPAATPHVPWWLVLLQGIAMLIIGLLLITNTGMTVYTLTVFLGVYWLIGGIFDLVGMFVDHSQWGWKLASGILGILAGVIIVRNPMWSAVILTSALVWLLAFAGIIIGVLGLIRAFGGAGLGAGVLAVISLVLGVILLFNTAISAVTLVYVAAIWALIAGVAAIVTSFQLRSSEKVPTPRPTVQPA